MRRKTIAIAATLVFTLAACGGDDDDSGDGGDTETTEAPSGDETTAPPTTEAAVDEAAEQEEAMTALEAFFTAFSQGDFDAAAVELENGEELKATFQDLYDGFAVADNALRAEALEATIINDTEAEVVYDLYFGATPDPVLPATSALMANVDGEWKVAESTWNALLELGATSATTVP
jgi:hypothetical protein